MVSKHFSKIILVNDEIIIIFLVDYPFKTNFLNPLEKVWKSHKKNKLQSIKSHFCNTDATETLHEP